MRVTIPRSSPARWAVLTGPILALATLGSAWATPAPLTPGEWQVRTQMHIAGVPAQAASMMNHLPPMEVCIRPGMTHPPLSPQAKADRCRVLHESQSGQKTYLTVFCAKPIPTTDHIAQTVSDQGKRFTQSSTATSHGYRSQTTLSGRWISAQCRPQSRTPLPSQP